MGSKRGVDKKWIGMMVLGAVVTLQLMMWASTPPPPAGLARSGAAEETCPGDCSQRGLCWHGHCYCPEGWNGRQCDRVVKGVDKEGEAEIVRALGDTDFGLYFVRSIEARSTMGGEAYSRETHAGNSMAGKHADERGEWRVNDGLESKHVARIDDPEQKFINAALGSRSTAMSSTYLQATSDLAVDGNLDGDYHKKSVAHSEFEANPWWEVDLEREIDVHYIVLWNRDDCCGERMADYTLFVSSQPFGAADSPESLQKRKDVWSTHVPLAAGFPTPSQVFPVHYTGRYVRLYVFGDETAINLAELQVFTTPRSPREGEKRGIPYSKMGLFLDASRKVKARYPYNDYQFEKVYTQPKFRTGYPLTIGAVPKAFSRDNPLVLAAQTNAILSWKALEPQPHIVLYGDDDGVAEFAEKHGLEHVPQMDTTKWGGPTLDFILEETAARADRYFMFINSDITLTGEFARSFRIVADKFSGKDWLLVGQRRNIPQSDPPHMIDFDSNHWEEDTRAMAKKVGLFNVWGEDYFLMTKTMFGEGEVLPFAVGRCAYDNWLVNTVLKKKAPVVDGSEVVLAVHFNHDYRHIKAGKDPWDTPECKYNKKLMKKKTDWYKGSTDHAQWVLKPCDGDVCIKKRK